MLKRYFSESLTAMLRLTVAVAFIMPAACTKPVAEGPTPPGGDDGQVVRLSVDSGTPSTTKASGISYDVDEAPVSRWAVFVFDDAGTCVLRYSDIGGAASVTHRLRTGVYSVRAVANYPTTGPFAFNAASVKSLAAFNALTVGLDANARGSLVMAGTTPADASAGTAEGTFKVVKTTGDDALDVCVHLKRLVSKVTLSSVKLEFTSASLRTKTVTLRHVYVTNAYTLSRYGSDYASTELLASKGSWYNCMGWHGSGGAAVSAAADAILGDRDVNLTLTQDGTTAINRTFYFYPNPTLISNDSHAAVWSGPRCTRLVLEVEVEGKPYYWQCNLPYSDSYAPMVRNMAYTVSGTVHSLGSRDPEQEIPPLIEWTFAASPITTWDGNYDIQEQS